MFTLRPFPCERAPPGLGLSCPQPDANHPARWVRFSAPRPWVCGCRLHSKCSKFRASVNAKKRAIRASRLHGATNEASVSAASIAHPQPARGGVGGSPLLAAAAVTPRARPSKHADLAGVVLTFAPLSSTEPRAPNDPGGE